MNAKLHHLVHALVSEPKDLLQLKPTVGALNCAGLVIGAVFGAVLIVASSTQQLLGAVLWSVVGEKKAAELLKYGDYTVIGFFLFLFTLCSLVCVVVDNRRK
ncbi:hypothetical protein [Roseateles sp. P5_E7]